MGVLSGLFKSRNKPINRTNGSAYSFLMGGSSSGRRVNERSASILWLLSFTGFKTRFWLYRSIAVIW